MTSDIRSWYLKHDGTTYWLSAADGENLRQLAEWNPRGYSGNVEFTPLGTTLPVVIHFGSDSGFTLTASGDD